MTRVNTHAKISPVAPNVDIEDLLDAQQVAELLGASTSRVVTVWRSRHPDFPAPIVDRPLGRLWHRPDIEAWGRSTGRIA